MKKSLVIATLTTLLVPLATLADRADYMQLSMGGSGHGMSKDSSGMGMSKDSSGMGMSKDSSGMGMSKDSSGMGMSKDSSGMGMSKDSSGMGMSKDSSGMGMSKDSSGMGMSKGMSGMSMQVGNQETSMMKVRNRMKNMIKQMEKIQSTTDIDKRDDLIANHYMNMNEGIKEMRGMGGNMMKHMQGDTKGHAMRGYVKKNHGTMTKKAMSEDYMTQRMERMEERLDMLQLMLEQVIESRQVERAQRHGHL